MIKERWWDPDYGLTWEEKLERRIKEARQKHREAEKRKAKLIAEIDQLNAYITELQGELNISLANV